MFSASPAVFVENRGQWADSSIRYMHQGSGANVLMTDSGPVFELFNPEETADAHAASRFPSPGTPGEGQGEGRLQRSRFSVAFVGANVVAPVGRNSSATPFNYLVGDQSNWRSNVVGYNTVIYTSLYSGIDLHTWGQRDSLKYEFHVAPGADWRQIALRYEGIEGLSIGSDGSLMVNLAAGWAPLRDDAPYVYQQINGRRVEVASSFVLVDESTYRFQIGHYDGRHELIIDPDLAWATYLGGSDSDQGFGVAVDSTGNTYVTGGTFSSGWATSGAYDTTHNGGPDVFVAKLDASGSSLLYATYLGGSSTDYGSGIAVDSAGNAYVTGLTDSSGWATSGAYDTTHNGDWDIFVLKLNPSGSSLLYATYLGGGSVDNGHDIAVDSAGNAYVTGWTGSSGWATSGAFDTTTNGSWDVCLAKLNSTGSSLLYATYLGGSNTDYGWDIGVDSAGNAYVTGQTDSAFWATNGAYDTTFSGSRDVFVAKLDPSGTSLLYATYLGGGGSGWGIALDSAGNAYVTGQTVASGWATSGAYDTTYSGRSDVFVAKLNPMGSSLLYATYLGGSSADYGYSIAVDSAGNAYVTGSTDSSAWATSGAYDMTHNGGSDVFVAKLNSTGSSLLYATYLGGSDNDYGRGIAVDPAGNAHVTGYTNSSKFPTTSGAYNTTSNGGNDVFVATFTPGPGIGSSSFACESSHAVCIQFSDDVSASLVKEDLTVQPVLPDGSLGSPIGVLELTFDPPTHLAMFQLPTPLPDGNYRATIAAGDVTDDLGHPMARDLILNFHILAADANRDRKVDLHDLMVLAKNWMGTGKTFSQGDFNYDGIVDSTDLGILATRWQQRMDPPVPTSPLPTDLVPRAGRPAVRRRAYLRRFCGDRKIFSRFLLTRGMALPNIYRIYVRGFARTAVFDKFGSLTSDRCSKLQQFVIAEIFAGFHAVVSAFKIYVYDLWAEVAWALCCRGKSGR